MSTIQIIKRSFHAVMRKQTYPALTSMPKLMVQLKRDSSYRSSKLMGSPEIYTDVEISQSPEEWKYVERLLPKKTIPEPTAKSDYPSGWRPSTEAAFKHPYYIQRNRNHMHPLYLKIGDRGYKRTTQLKRIHGDIWALQDDLMQHLKQRSGKRIYMQVHEVCCQINIKGDYVSLVEEWLQDKGF